MDATPTTPTHPTSTHSTNAPIRPYNRQDAPQLTPRNLLNQFATPPAMVHVQALYDEVQAAAANAEVNAAGAA